MIATDDFALFSRVLKERSGLVITTEKTYLLESRLLPVARKHGMTTLGQLAAALRDPSRRELMREVVEAMTTNESFFFRDNWPFERFRNFMLPELLKARALRKSLRIWSAACSTGQEPYSLAMILADEKKKLEGWRVEILATDLSTEILEKAKAGLYSHFEVQRGLPIQLLAKYFKPQGDRWELDPTVRQMVRFQQMNLLDDGIAIGEFDIIFCRNVLIYFDQPTKAKVLDRMSRMLPADGYLLLGGAETVLGLSEKFQPLPNQRGIYAPAGAAALAKAV